MNLQCILNLTKMTHQVRHPFQNSGDMKMLSAVCLLHRKWCIFDFLWAKFVI
jgi:hypothetical protein